MRFIVLAFALLLLSCEKDKETNQELFNIEYSIQTELGVEEFKIIDRETNKVIKHIIDPVFKSKHLANVYPLYMYYEITDRFDVYEGQKLSLIYTNAYDIDRFRVFKIKVGRNSNYTNSYRIGANKRDIIIDFEINTSK